MIAEADVRIHLSSFKPEIKELSKKVKQCHLLTWGQSGGCGVENIVIFIKMLLSLTCKYLLLLL